MKEGFAEEWKRGERDERGERSERGKIGKIGNPFIFNHIFLILLFINFLNHFVIF